MDNVKELKAAQGFYEQMRNTNFKLSSYWQGDDAKDAETSFLFVAYDHYIAHTHKDFCEIHCVFSGEIMNYVNEEGVLMKSGDCCLIRKEDVHLIQPIESEKKDYLAINFVIKYDYFLKLKHLFGEKISSVFDSDEMKLFHLSDDERINLLNKSYLLQTPNREYSSNSEFECKCIIIDLLKKLVLSKMKFDEKADAPDWLKTLLAKMQSNVSGQKSLNDFVAEVPYSYAYVAREFKRYIGAPMVNYFTTIKLEYAKDLILKTDKKILDVASEIGYSSLSHFNYIFKKTYGISPSQFRSQKRKVICVENQKKSGKKRAEKRK